MRTALQDPAPVAGLLVTTEAMIAEAGSNAKTAEYGDRIAMVNRISPSTCGWDAAADNVAGKRFAAALRRARSNSRRWRFRKSCRR
ncbi:hypothetical protein CK222_25805 [Mesorhizobium sp. WSM3866]|nr:hypothetical protein CK221_02545 [Mesorhizobium sp. WSM3868]PBB40792.1 hypothetical protein CK222_25805 [Mesorhizobium sp. WSM3866]PBB58892.1 hypothetical protein CK217_27480 [Mesorhizobium loti]PBB80108.1 hypothetical protein CK218_15830 [Mesorhizobium sp. WSM3879]PBB85088.1 hypothetical protein CK216_19550 [Mesorhizobium sp. WSM3876]